MMEFNPATRTFQALRIFINDEFGELKSVLAKSKRCIKRKWSVSGYYVPLRRRFNSEGISLKHTQALKAQRFF
jgi:hypothetical protein